MSLHQLANQLAAKGRNGDTTLVHMTKGEVAGLQALAKRHGTTLTRNPDTGLPEAFGLKQLLPIAAGVALGPAGYGLTAMQAGMAVGALGYMHSGSLAEGVKAGMGAYGGGTMSEGMSFAGEKAAEESTKQAIQDAAVTSSTPAVTTPSLTETVPLNTSTTAGVDGVTSVQPTTAGVDGVTTVQPAPDTSLANTTRSARPTFTKADALPTNSEILWDNVKENPLTAAGTAYGAMLPEQEEYKPQEANVDRDMGQRLAYDSGYDNSVPGRTGTPSYTKISDEEAKKIYGFADGGDVQYPYGESVVRMADGGSASTSVGYEAGPFSGADFSGYGSADVGNYSGYGGADVGNYSGYDAAPNAGRGISALPTAARASSVAAPSQGFRYDPMSRSYVGSGTNAPYLGGGQYGNSFSEIGDSITNPMGGTWTIVAAEGGLMDSYAQGGISTLGGYSDGGRLLKGPGDGVSDSIPAVIGKKQPARLADGEFVVPARIVSEIGNGSTEAGARKLYAMMDRVQKARGKTVGKGKVAKNTRADKFLPV